MNFARRAFHVSGIISAYMFVWCKAVFVDILELQVLHEQVAGILPAKKHGFSCSCVYSLIDYCCCNSSS